MAKPPATAAAIQAAYAQALKLHQGGDVKAARKAYLDILKTRALAEPMFQLGRIAEAGGDGKTAAKWYARALKLKPKEPALWQALVGVSRGKDRDKAVAGAKAAGVAVQVEDPLARGDAALAKGDLAKAKAAYRAAMLAGLPKLTALLHMSTRLRAAGFLDDARTAAEEAMALAPESGAAVAERAMADVDAGEMEAARAGLRTALDLAPYLGPAWSVLISSEKQAEGSADLARLESLVEAGVSDRTALRLMSYALAKGLEDQGRDREMFEHLTRANRLTASAFPYGFDADLTRARALIAQWAPVTGGYEGAAPIFVTGLPRSGTTLVETILSKHGQVAAGGEMALFGKTLTPVIDRAVAGEALSAADWTKVGQAYAEATARVAGTAERITDKSISTFSIIGYVANALPRAKFLIMDRDPRDVGLSIYKNAFPDGTHRYANDLTELGRYIRLHEACVAAWEARLPDHIHRVDYAQLTAEPEAHIRAILEFCDLPWDPACLSPETSNRSVKTLSYAQVRQPIHRGSVAAWQRFEAELQPLIAALDAHQFDLDGPRA